MAHTGSLDDYQDTKFTEQDYSLQYQEQYQYYQQYQYQQMYQQYQAMYQPTQPSTASLPDGTSTVAAALVAAVVRRLAG